MDTEPAMDLSHQPRVRGNDWRSLLSPPDLGDWSPGLSVTVVIPSFNSAATLPYTLASLAAQSYPEHLLEVVVVDDQGSPPVELPEVRPSPTRVVTATTSWGRANACKQGAAAAEGDVIHWVDSDMVLYRDHVEAHMRWHHMIDYAVVLGQKMFVDPSDGLPDVEKVHQLIAQGRAEEIFNDQWSAPHDWVEGFYERSDDLSTAAARAFLANVGATGSVHRALYADTGGFDAALKLGEDIELGYRLSQCGAVFIPDRAATSWHLGRSTVMMRELEVNRYNQPFLVDRVSQLRRLRQPGFRSYAVPYIQVVVDTRGHDLEEVQAAVDCVLGSSIKDIVCFLVGDWDDLPDDRVAPMDDHDREARLVRGTYGSDPRIRLVQDVAVSAYPAAFRATLPAGWRPSPKFLASVTADMDKRAHGLRSVMMPDGSVARVERTSAVNRMARLRLPNEDKDDVLDEVYGTWWSAGADEGFKSLADIRSGSTVKAKASGGAGHEVRQPSHVHRPDAELTPGATHGTPTGRGWSAWLSARRARRR
jgi:GT2 family glycosyltransferase